MRRQGSLQNAQRPQPYALGIGALSWGKVVARHEDGTVDVAMQAGGTYRHVPVSSWSLGSQVGEVYLPAHDLTSPTPNSQGPWDVPGASGKADVFAVVGFLEGNARRPIVMSFMPPAISQMVFQTKGIKVSRHESGVYHVTLPSGQDEVHWPDGSFLVWGGTASYDMAQENANWAPPTASAGPITLHHSSGATVTITAAGEIQLQPASGQVVSVGSGSSSVALADLVATAFNQHTHDVTTSSGTYTTGTPNQQMTSSGIGAADLESS